MNRILSKLKALTIVEVNLKSVWIASSPTTQHDNQEPARTMLSHWSCLPPSFSLCAPLPTLFHPHIHYLLCVFDTHRFSSSSIVQVALSVQAETIKISDTARQRDIKCSNCWMCLSRLGWLLHSLGTKETCQRRALGLSFVFLL